MTSVADIVIGYFLEDRAQEKFVRAVVGKVANVAPHSILLHEIRSATGGAPVVMAELDRFLRDCQRGTVGPFGILVVCVDADCEGYTAKRNRLQERIQARAYPGPCAFGIADPHIERWYLLDPAGFARAVGVPSPGVPPIRCDKGLFKVALRDAFSDLNPPLGGIEAAEDIVEEMDLYTAGRNDSAFKHFTDEIKEGLARLSGAAT